MSKKDTAELKRRLNQPLPRNTVGGTIDEVATLHLMHDVLRHITALDTDEVQWIARLEKAVLALNADKTELISAGDRLVSKWRMYVSLDNADIDTAELNDDVEAFRTVLTEHNGEIQP